jgi:hypothetical protein
VQLDGPRQFVERRAGGHHIVDQQQSLAGEIRRAVEGAADVPARSRQGRSAWAAVCRMRRQLRGSIGIARPQLTGRASSSA